MLRHRSMASCHIHPACLDVPVWRRLYGAHHTRGAQSASPQHGISRHSAAVRMDGGECDACHMYGAMISAATPTLRLSYRHDSNYPVHLGICRCTTHACSAAEAVTATAPRDADRSEASGDSGAPPSPAAPTAGLIRMYNPTSIDLGRSQIWQLLKVGESWQLLRAGE